VDDEAIRPPRQSTDCFASLAMTEKANRRSQNLRFWSLGFWFLILFRN
jgi:hypothetical protein